MKSMNALFLAALVTAGIVGTTALPANADRDWRWYHHDNGFHRGWYNHNNLGWWNGDRDWRWRHHNWNNWNNWNNGNNWVGSRRWSRWY